MKYVDTKVVFREVPDEITLAINISGCPVRCPGCHSSYLTQDVGSVLDENVLESLIKANPGISCVSFMGGDADPLFIRSLAAFCSSKGLKTCWYSGRSLREAQPLLDTLDFIKVGPFIDECGPLDSPSTNQRFYRITKETAGPVLEDWTGRFLKKYL